ncbi:hypothetical protein D3C75_830690 [compost metagenome]
MISTTQELCDHITEHYPQHIEEHGNVLNAAVWFCCIQEAISASEMNTKDLARMFMNGVEGYNNHRTESVQLWIDLYIAYCAECCAYKEEYEPLESVLKTFYTTKQH